MALPLQQSLFEAGGGTPMVESARWIEGVMLGEIALGVCVIAVAFIGGLMLTGRIDVRRGFSVLLGCHVLFGAPIIAKAFLDQSDSGRVDSDYQLNSNSQETEGLRKLHDNKRDPYAGV
jgi:type IV secretory pathway VirB2 component (pilin)